jgi:hypothetical protein
MIKPDAADFRDAFVNFTRQWRPDLMDKISLADISIVWGHIETLYEEAKTRDPIGSRIVRLEKDAS